MTKVTISRTVAKVNTRTDTTYEIYVTILMIFVWKQSGTSHGKSACDGVGGTVKRPATKASLKRQAHNQILTPLDMFSYCESDVIGIKFFYMSSTTIKENVILLQDRYNVAQTVKGTRQLHIVRATTTRQALSIQHKFTGIPTNRVNHS